MSCAFFTLDCIINMQILCMTSFFCHFVRLGRIPPGWRLLMRAALCNALRDAVSKLRDLNLDKRLTPQDPHSTPAEYDEIAVPN